MRDVLSREKTSFGDTALGMFLGIAALVLAMSFAAWLLGDGSAGIAPNAPAVEARP